MYMKSPEFRTHSRKRMALAAAAVVLAGAGCTDATHQSDGNPRSTTTDKATTTTIYPGNNTTTSPNVVGKESTDITVNKLLPDVEYFASFLVGDESGEVQKMVMAPDADLGENIKQYSLTVDKDGRSLRINFLAEQKPGDFEHFKSRTISEFYAELVEPGNGEKTADNPDGENILAHLKGQFIAGSGKIASFHGGMGDQAFSSQPLYPDHISATPDQNRQAAEQGYQTAQQAMQLFESFVGTK